MHSQPDGVFVERYALAFRIIYLVWCREWFRSNIIVAAATGLRGLISFMIVYRLHGISCVVNFREIVYIYMYMAHRVTSTLNPKPLNPKAP